MARALPSDRATGRDGMPASPKPSLRAMLTVRISSLSELLRRSSTLANRRKFGLSWIEWRVISQVGEHAPLSLNQLADLLNLDRGQVSRAVKGLALRGLLSRTPRPGGPSIVIAVTDEGGRLHARMVDLAMERYDFLVSGLSAEEIEQAGRALDALQHRAQLLLDRERAVGPGDDPFG